jgi:uncharacterized Rmd1/YagE family protein
MATRLMMPGNAGPVRALLMGERIDLRGMESTQRLGSSPLVISAGEARYAVLFRYGVVVLFGMNPLEEVSFLKNLEPMVGQSYEKKETEEAELRIDPTKKGKSFFATLATVCSSSTRWWVGSK